MPDIVQGFLGEMLPMLTEKQLCCLRAIVQFYSENKYYPSRRELADVLGISASNVSQYVNFLIKKEYLMLEGGRRNIRLTEKALMRVGVITQIEVKTEKNT